MLDPVGFWSYARQDDNHSDGQLSELRAIVGKAINLQQGAEVTLWQDVAAIPYGADWAATIERAIAQTTFFIPVLTPRFLKSQNCFDEFMYFRGRMTALNRDDLIFPVHYIDVGNVPIGETVFGGSLAVLRRTQWIDFRSLLFHDSSSPEVRQWASNFSRSILRAMRRWDLTVPSITPPARNATPRTTVNDGGKTGARVNLDRDPFKSTEKTVIERPLLATFWGHTGPVESAKFSPDGRRVVTAAKDRCARLWDAGSGMALATFRGIDRTMQVQFSQDSSRIATVADDGIARLWDSQTGGQIHSLAGHKTHWLRLNFSRDSTRILTWSEDKTAFLWDAWTGERVASLFEYKYFLKNTPCTGAHFSPDGACIVTTSDDYAARLWNTKDGNLLAALTGHLNSLRSTHFSRDSRRIVTASDDHTARVWNARTGEYLTTLSGHANPLREAYFSPNNSRILTKDDQTAWLWDASTGALLAVLAGHKKLDFAHFSPDGDRVVTGCFDRSARGVYGDRPALRSDRSEGLLDTTPRLWDAETGALVATLTGHMRPVSIPYFSSDGSRVITNSDDGRAQLWDARTGKRLAILSGHVKFVQFSSDSRYILSASPLGFLSTLLSSFRATLYRDPGDSLARTWDAHTGEPLAILSHEQIRYASFSPDGSRVVTASNDHTAQVWETKSGTLLGTLYHGGAVTTAQFSPDGSSVLTTSDDHTARLWDAIG